MGLELTGRIEITSGLDYNKVIKLLQKIETLNCDSTVNWEIFENKLENKTLAVADLLDFWLMINENGEAEKRFQLSYSETIFSENDMSNIEYQYLSDEDRIELKTILNDLVSTDGNDIAANMLNKINHYVYYNESYKSEEV